MSEIILHHYPFSLFAEKIRRILAYKDVAWRCVEQPIVAPKPDLTALTGGYRRIPVMQIGADVYCDSACIARRLETLFPEPSCFPTQQIGVAQMIEDWADRRLVAQIMPTMVLAMLPRLPPDILVDREALSPTMTKPALTRVAPYTFAQARLSLDRIDAQLRDRPFLLGDAFSIADAACFHPIWFMKHDATAFAEVESRRALAAWFGRIESFGCGRVEAMTNAAALATAREATPQAVPETVVAIPGGLVPGDQVTVLPDDYGPEETHGTLAGLTADTVTILRHDPALRDIAVHFPRVGYRVFKRQAPV
jgi:glutathione S-transferase